MTPYLTAILRYAVPSALTAASLYFLWRRIRTGKPAVWAGGFPMSITSQVLFTLGHLALLPGFFAGRVVPVSLLSIPCFVALMVFHFLDRNAYRKKMKGTFGRNAEKHPSVFSKSSPRSSSAKLPRVREFAIYDNETAVFLGNLDFSQLKTLVEKHESWDLDTNDFFILSETIDKLRDEQTDPALVSFLRKALGKRNSMEIRWIPKTDQNARAK